MQAKIISEYDKMSDYIVRSFVRDYPNMLIRSIIIMNGEFNMYWDEKEKEWHNKK